VTIAECRLQSDDRRLKIGGLQIDGLGDWRFFGNPQSVDPPNRQSTLVDRQSAIANLQLDRNLQYLSTLQAEGNYAKAKDLIERLGIVRPEVQKVLDRLAGIPVDIEPKFVTAAELTPR
jgi:hypothetical protein